MKKITLTLLIGALVSGCGGGDSATTGTNSSSPTPNEPTTEPMAAVQISGTVYQGLAVSNAQVTLVGVDGRYIVNTATTTSQGRYQLRLANQAYLPVYVQTDSAGQRWRSLVSEPMDGEVIAHISPLSEAAIRRLEQSAQPMTQENFITSATQVLAPILGAEVKVEAFLNAPDFQARQSDNPLLKPSTADLIVEWLNQSAQTSDVSLLEYLQGSERFSTPLNQQPLAQLEMVNFLTNANLAFSSVSRELTALGIQTSETEFGFEQARASLLALVNQLQGWGDKQTRQLAKQGWIAYVSAFAEQGAASVSAAMSDTVAQQAYVKQMRATFEPESSVMHSVSEQQVLAVAQLNAALSTAAKQQEQTAELVSAAFNQKAYQNLPVLTPNAQGKYEAAVLQAFAAQLNRIAAGEEAMPEPIVAQVDGLEPEPEPDPWVWTAERKFKLLQMSSFGPTKDTLAELERFTPEYWLNRQLSMPSAYDQSNDDWPTHLQRTIEIAQLFEPGTDYYRTGVFNESNADGDVLKYQMAAWWENALGSKRYTQVGSDQLRQRMAYALSQLLVVSDAAFPLDVHGEGLAHYYDLLAQHAFGNYRQLLGAIARSPAMGVFLSHAANQKASIELASRPDENFARELIQLFSVGLYLLNEDGSVQTDQNGQPIAAYQQEDVEELAKVMTGWNLSNSQAFRSVIRSDGDYTRQMTFNRDYHEDEADAFYQGQGDGEIMLLGQAVALDARDQMTDGLGNLTFSGLDASLDVLFAHPNVPVFVSLHLIKHFVTSNPSPEYVQRVSEVFRDDGNGQRGNLRAVLKAILLDQEAYQTTLNYGGKIKEPILAFTQILRGLNAAPWRTPWVSNNDTEIRDVYWFRAPEEALSQAPLRSPSVFNFYRPDFIPSDPALMAQGVTAPEMQIQTDQFFANFSNFLTSVVRRNEWVYFDKQLGYSPLPNYWTSYAIQVDFTEVLTLMEQAMEGDNTLDFATINQDQSYDSQGLNPKQRAVNALLTWFNQRFFGGSLSVEVQLHLERYLNEGLSRNRDDQRLYEAHEMVQELIMLVMPSPVFMVQN